MTAEKPLLFKDYYNPDSVGNMARTFRSLHRSFDARRFVRNVLTDEFKHAELKERTRILARALKTELPEAYGRAVSILIRVAPSFGSFDNWVLTTYVELYGLEHFDDSMCAMYQLTRYGTAEFTIRPFIIRDPERMLTVLRRWVNDDNEHVRRLVAEGTRPRGVWCEHIPAFRRDPSPVVELLEQLNTDPSLYVRKAVANNLNDISRDNPNIAIGVAREWMKKRHPFTNWIVKRACRSLIKSGHPAVFPMFGFTANPKITIAGLHVSRSRIAIGDTPAISFNLVSGSAAKQKLVIDYRITYRTKLGRMTHKVFKCAEKTLAPSETIPISIRHTFRNHSTRTHYPGKHVVEILVNGIVVDNVTVTLS